MRRYTFPILAIFCGFLGLGFMAGRAFAEPDAQVLVDAGSASASSPTTPDVFTELSTLKQAYSALKDAKDPSAKPLLWASLIAIALRTLLALANAIWTKPKKWLAWVALGVAVPIALLSHYAAGHGWMAALIVAGGGPGAILVNEVLKLAAKKPVVA
jgi:hypothetical protein